MSQPTCPICNRPALEPRYAPFCGKRCADVDLQRWFSGRYAVPAAEQEPDGEDMQGTDGPGQGRGPHL